MTIFEAQQNEFAKRHIGSIGTEQQLLKTIAVQNMEELIGKTVPASIRNPNKLNVPDAISEADLLKLLKEISLNNKLNKNYLLTEPGL